MKIGYEGFPLGVNEADCKDWNLENSNEEKWIEIISCHLKYLGKLLEYNTAHDIGFYCLDSNMISFGLNNHLELPWWEIFSSEFNILAKKMSEAKIRISMHPDKLNLRSVMNEDVFSDTVKCLDLQAKILKALNLGTEHKIIIQLGDADHGKKEGLEKFKKIFSGLDKNVQMRLALMNDSSHYNIQEMIWLGESLDLPVVFHNRNHLKNPPILEKDELEWIRECKKTWKEIDGAQIVYYAELTLVEPVDSIEETIGIKRFLEFCEKMDSTSDIMLEASDRNLSAVKCTNCIRKDKDIKLLELEWRKYKYTVLENSHRTYLQIRSLLKEKGQYPAVSFYLLIEEALAGEKREGFVNAAQHVWGYFKKCATEIEKRDFLMMMEEYKTGKIKMDVIKKKLWELSVKYEMKYLLESYYFLL